MPRLGSVLQLARQAIPTRNPPAGEVAVFADSATGRLASKDSTGAVASIGAAVVRLDADVGTTSASPVDVTGLTFPVAAGGTYVFSFFGVYTTGASTTGIRLGMNGPTVGANGFLTAVLLGDSTAGTSQVGGATGAYDTHNQPSASGSWGTYQPFIMQGSGHFASAGTLALRMWSEVAGSVVSIKRGAAGQLWRVS